MYWVWPHVALYSPPQYKNLSLEALKAGSQSPSSNTNGTQKMQDRETIDFCLQRRGPTSGPCGFSEQKDSPSSTGWLPVFITQLSAECLVEETGEAYNATSRTSSCVRSVVTWPNTWWLFSFRGGIAPEKILSEYTVFSACKTPKQRVVNCFCVFQIENLSAFAAAIIMLFLFHFHLHF